nr:hypothetical protein [uncultured Chitinophaga sp.]
MRNENVKTLEKFSAFNAQLSQEEMTGAQGGQGGYTMIKFSQEITAAGTWITEDYYVDGKYSYSSTTPDGCK